MKKCQICKVKTAVWRVGNDGYGALTGALVCDNFGCRTQVSNGGYPVTFYRIKQGKEDIMTTGLNPHHPEKDELTQERFVKLVERLAQQYWAESEDSGWEGFESRIITDPHGSDADAAVLTTGQEGPLLYDFGCFLQALEAVDLEEKSV